jgi:hypothetical protein
MPQKTSTSKLRRKYGVVALFDALGSRNYTDAQIKKFLAARSQINETVTDLAKQLPDLFPTERQREIKGMCLPTIFTFGDTIVVTIELRSQRYFRGHLLIVLLLLRRYLFHAFEEGILFRGSYSIGFYIEDASTNTVMGPAVADAAAWYDQSDWMGVASTPHTVTVLDYHSLNRASNLIHPTINCRYQVPFKDGTTRSLYCLSWPGAFFDKDMWDAKKGEEPKKYVLRILKDLPVPAGTESKYENTKRFFEFVEKEISQS